MILPDSVAGLPELTELRGLKSKTFQLPDGSRRLIVSKRRLHTPADFTAWRNGQPTQLLDVDDTLDDDGTQLTPRNLWYGMQIPKDQVGVRFLSRETGAWVAIRLIATNGTALGTIPTPVRVGRKLIWHDVVPDLDIILDIREDNVELFKLLRSAVAPRRLLWQVTESAERSIPLDLVTKGHDNANMAEPTRDDLGPGRVRRNIEMAAPVLGAETTLANGAVTYSFLERWTGRTIALDANRVPSPSTDVVYPVLIDVTLNLSIAANADDGDQGITTAWNNSYGSTGDHIIYDPSGTSNSYMPGWRFTSVTVPAGATINSATLTLTFTRAGSSGAGPTATVYGHAADNSGAWGTSDGPKNRTKTTANAAFGAWGGGLSVPFTRNITVTTIVAEICGRGGWASGNALSLFATFTDGSSAAYQYIDDLAGGSSGIAALAIDYTSSGAAVQPMLMLLGVGS